jgi:hypothetical protein
MNNILVPYRYIKDYFPNCSMCEGFHVLLDVFQMFHHQIGRAVDTQKSYIVTEKNHFMFDLIAKRTYHIYTNVAVM